MAGVLVSILCSAAAFKWGAQQTDRQKAELVAVTNRQKAALSLELHEVRSMLSTFAHSVESGLATSNGPVARRLSRPDRRGEGVRGEGLDTGTQYSPTTELLVRASLGALVDERGEVRLQRLLDEVATALGVPSQAATISAIQHLRDDGLVDWDGAADLSNVQSIRVQPPGEHRHHLSTVTTSETITS